MDRLGPIDQISVFVRKYRYGILVLMVGIGLMLIPTAEKKTTIPESTEITIAETGIEGKLADILSQIEGTGKTKVLLTIAEGEQVLYQCDEEESTGTDTATYHREVVIVTDSQRKEQGLVRQVIPPKYQGAIIVCQGADKATVRLQVVEAVVNVTGLTADKITVLKMK